MTDMSDIDPIVTDVILEEEEVSIIPSDSELEGASISASQVGPNDALPRQPSAGSSQRPGSALTVENVRLHEQNVERNEERSLSRHGSANSKERPLSRGSLGPVRAPGSGTPVRLCSAKSGLGNVADETTPTINTVRTGSGKREPLPPIGAELGQTGLDMSRLTIVSRERRDDGETDVSSARMSARSERSVSFRESAERSQLSTSEKSQMPAKSPAVREVNRTKDPDGQDRVTISMATETEWSWLEMLSFLGKTEEELINLSANIRPDRSKSTLSHVSRASRQSLRRENERLEGREGRKFADTEGAADQEDERDMIPPLEMDSDSEYSFDEDDSKTQDVPKIGPPKIIKYQRESEQIPISKKYRDAAHVQGKDLDFDFSDLDSADFSDKEDLELEARIRGRKKTPEELYFEPEDRKSRKKVAEFKVDVEEEDRIEEEDGEQEGIDGSRISLQKLEEEKEVCEFCGSQARPFPTLVMQKTMDSSELYCCKDFQDLVEYTVENTALSQHPSEEMIDIAPHAPYGSKQARRAAKERAAQRMREREMARQKAAGANQANFYALQAHNRIEILDGVARQMKTINYSLSSQRCLDEGWTVRPPTPEEEDEMKPVFVPEPNAPQLPVIFKQRKKQKKETAIVRKKYNGGEPFMVMFDDGTGVVFYPSGKPAIIIANVDKNQYAHYVYSDPKQPTHDAKLLAVFEPNGNGTCYHNNGNIRLNINQFGGIFTDPSGSIKKKWSWKDEDTLSKTPPFQPLCFSLNQQISLRCMTQDQIFINFSCDLQTCRFNAGAKLKLIAPVQVPPKEVDRDMLYISEVKTYVQMVKEHISMQKNFSKSPKLDNLPVSRKIESSIKKNERLKHKYVDRKVAKKTGHVVIVK